MNTITIQSTSLHSREGSSDKVYQAATESRGEGHIVTFTYGRRGSTLTTGTKSDVPLPLETATKLFNKLVASKVAKGYQPDGQPATAYQQSWMYSHFFSSKRLLPSSLDVSGRGGLGRALPTCGIHREKHWYWCPGGSSSNF